MGESRYRKLHDPTYGTVPKSSTATQGQRDVHSPTQAVPELRIHERGLVISSPMDIDIATNSVISSGGLDTAALRADLLFWDRLVWPQNGFFGYNSPEVDFLEQAGVLFRPRIPFSGAVADIVYNSHMTGFRQLDAREPGKWALAGGANSLLTRRGDVAEGRGVLLRLIRAVPVPDVAVPLEDVLEFRNHRRDEMLCLRSELEQFYESVISAEDQDFALTRFAEKIDAACVDILKVSKERRFPVRLADLSPSVNLKAVAVGAVSWLVAKGAGLDNMTALAAVGTTGLLSMIDVKAGLGLNRSSVRSSPYRYVVHIHNELI